MLLQLPKATNNFTEGLESYSRYFRKLLVEELRASLQSDFEEMTRLPGPLPGLTLQVSSFSSPEGPSGMLQRFCTLVGVARALPGASL